MTTVASNLPVAATRATRLSRPEVLATFFQGLSDPTRIRILELLAERPRTVTEIQQELGLAQGRISSHLACLRWCGYVLAVADGRFNRYQIVDPRVQEILADAESIVRENAERLTSCLVLATESDELVPTEDGGAG